MIQTRPAEAKSWWKTPPVGLDDLAPRCAALQCRGHQARWHGLLHRREGIRCNAQWYCSSACLEQALAATFDRIIAEPPAPPRAIEHRMPLGLLLLARRVISHAQLLSALDEQRICGGRIGERLRVAAGLTEEQIAAAVATQWSCPMFPANRETMCLEMMPVALQQASRMVPLHHVPAANDLYLGFTVRPEHSVLYALERMLGCHTIPCVVTERQFGEKLESAQAGAGINEYLFERTTTGAEMARIVSGYSRQSGAEALRFMVAGPFVWVRIAGVKATLDLLFRRPA